ncbi:MAG: 3-oxoacyl-[acyl-carrier-protein] reductase [Verrucomicrobia bacterium]|nr:3-oxoacyl-[acyl-carrier-protein] reductase [Verrucomicrobiota bacterium]MCF7707532.1 3-oxoacyl-[acyl-carrier-protein] reductase [Verrucomicrobiota bacterium]
MSELLNNVAVVTGAGRGIGKAIAIEFAKNGADVFCVSRTRENAESTASDVRALERRAWPLAVDVGDIESVNAAVDKIMSEAGRVDILVNNAGITRDTLVMRMSDDDWDDVMTTNLKGAFLFTRALSMVFVKQRAGRIINIGSVAGIMGNPGQANYSASKAGLIGFSKSVARELASRGITVNVIAPGFIDTNMTSKLGESVRKDIQARIPMNTFGSPEDIAKAAVFLAGGSGKYITGHVLSVDGGLAM